MWSKVIVLLLKRLGYGADLVHAREQVCVKYFGAVKTLDIAILCWLTRLNKLQLDLFVFGPELHVVARVLRAIGKDLPVSAKDGLLETFNSLHTNAQ